MEMMNLVHRKILTDRPFHLDNHLLSVGQLACPVEILDLLDIMDHQNQLDVMNRQDQVDIMDNLVRR